MYRIGVDVGGTNTDSVILDTRPSELSNPHTRGVLAFHKHPTTPNVTNGIELAVQRVLEEAARVTQKPLQGIKDDVSSLTIGTTHFINAVVQSDSRRLRKVAVLRLGKPYTEECPSFVDFPRNLERIMNGYTAILSGGLQIDGRVIGDIVEEELVEQAKIIKEKGLKDVVLVGIFSPLDVSGSQEYAARDILRRELGNDTNIVCSRDVGQLGLLERENASILNASISNFAQLTIKGFQNAMKRLGLKCPLYITQNDGTLTTASSAAQLPIRTFSSGATNSMRGASFLAGIGIKTMSERAIIVADVGGTTTDVGVLLPSGFPRQAAAFIEVGGVRTNFAMPDVQSIGLGGGSRVRVQEDGRVTVGPDSVGHYLADPTFVPVSFASLHNRTRQPNAKHDLKKKLTRDAISFGGNTLTATDIVVKAGVAQVDDIDVTHESKAKLEQSVPDEVVTKARASTKRMFETVIDRMKTSPEDCTLLLVGGGSILAAGWDELKGVGEVVTPPFHTVANAVGAAIANVSGEIDTIAILNAKDREQNERALDSIKQSAIQKAVLSGAKEETVKVVEVHTVPVPYVNNGATRVVVRAVGEVGEGVRREEADGDEGGVGVEEEEEEGEGVEEGEEGEDEKKGGGEQEEEEDLVDFASYKPRVEGGVWYLSETDLLFLMEGTGILGTGGGGSPYPAYLMARQLLRSSSSSSSSSTVKMRIVDHTRLKDDAKILRGGGMGSPSVSSERIVGGRGVVCAWRELGRYLYGPAPPPNREQGKEKEGEKEGRGRGWGDAVLCDEIGGGNGMKPFITSAYWDLPVLDGDLMGRAYPLLNQILPAVYNRPNALLPCALSTPSGATVLLTHAKSQNLVETIMRSVTTELGSSAALVTAPLALGDVRDYGVVRSQSLAWWVGRCVCVGRQGNRIKQVPEEILKVQNGRVLFAGKIIGVRREVRAGFTWGEITIAKLGEDEVEEPTASPNTPALDKEGEEQHLIIPFQNENLAAYLVDPSSPTKKRKMLAIVPDLIAVLDSQSMSHLGTQMYTYGLRVTVIALAGSPLWTTEVGLRVGGPGAFGLEDEYVPVGEYKTPRSVIEVFGSL